MDACDGHRLRCVSSLLTGTGCDACPLSLCVSSLLSSLLPMEVDVKRNDVNVKMDADVARKCKIVASARGISMAEYSERAGSAVSTEGLEGRDAQRARARGAAGAARRNDTTNRKTLMPKPTLVGFFKVILCLTWCVSPLGGIIAFAVATGFVTLIMVVERGFDSLHPLATQHPAPAWPARSPSSPPAHAAHAGGIDKPVPAAAPPRPRTLDEVATEPAKSSAGPVEIAAAAAECEGVNHGLTATATTCTTPARPTYPSGRSGATVRFRNAWPARRLSAT